MMPPPPPKIVTADEIEAAIVLDLELVDAIEAAFASAGRGEIAIPPIQQILLPEIGGNVCVKSATATGETHFVLKAASNFPHNAERGLPNAGGLMIVFDAKSGLATTVLLDNGYLTALRTAAAGAVAARLLSRPDSRTLAIVGTGLQAEFQARAVLLVRPIERIVVAGRNGDAGGRLAERLATTTGRDCRYEGDAATAARQADIVVTTTAATQPILDIDDVRPGTHVTAMGSDAPGKGELSSRLLDAATHYVCDSIAQCTAVGEFGGARHRGETISARPVDLCRLLADGGMARQAADITIADLTGIGAQDLAIALLATRRLT